MCKPCWCVAMVFLGGNCFQSCLIPVQDVYLLKSSSKFSLKHTDGAVFYFHVYLHGIM